MLHRSIVLFAVLTVLTGCTSCAPQRVAGHPDRVVGPSAARPQRRAAAAPGNQPTTGTVVFQDEFDGPLDTSVWRPYHSTYGDGNHELQCHTPANVVDVGRRR